MAWAAEVEFFMASMARPAGLLIRFAVSQKSTAKVSRIRK